MKSISIGEQTFVVSIDTAAGVYGPAGELNKLIKALIPLLKSCISRTCYTHIAGWEQEDYLQALMPYVLKTIEKFDPEKNVKFSTYLTHCMRYKLINIYSTHGNGYYLARYSGQLKGQESKADQFKYTTVANMLNASYMSEAEGTHLEEEVLAGIPFGA